MEVTRALLWIGGSCTAGGVVVGRSTGGAAGEGHMQASTVPGAGPHVLG